MEEGMSAAGEALAVALAFEGEVDEGWMAEDRETIAGVAAERQGEWRAGRLALRRAAASVLGGSASGLRLAPYRPGTAAGLEIEDSSGARSRAPLHVSVSHRDGRAVAVADPVRAVGVDLERDDAVPAGLERYFVAETERTAAATDLTRLWCLKEAAWKALGCGAELPFRELALEFDEAGEVRGVLVGTRRFPARARLSSPWPGYLLAIVWTEEES
jgi:phosphopantetheinyl transferase